jgi:hypothetical protein
VDSCRSVRPCFCVACTHGIRMKLKPIASRRVERPGQPATVTTTGLKWNVADAVLEFGGLVRASTCRCGWTSPRATACVLSCRAAQVSSSNHIVGDVVTVTTTRPLVWTAAVVLDGWTECSAGAVHVFRQLTSVWEAHPDMYGAEPLVCVAHRRAEVWGCVHARSDEIGFLPPLASAASDDAAASVMVCGDRDAKLGVVATVLPPLYTLCQLMLAALRRFDVQPQHADRVTRALLVINPEHQSAWNVRKALVSAGNVALDADSALVELVLRKRPKSGETWNHR